MLVLSRRTNDKVLFPNLGITVQIIRIDSKRVRLGIEAPADVQVLRHELVDESNLPKQVSTGLDSRKKNHELRNRLNMVIVGLHLLQRKLEFGLVSEAEETLSTMLEELQQLNDQLESNHGESRESLPVEPRRALIVEDCTNEAELLAGYLRTFGYDVFTVADGWGALDFLASQTRPDVILLDMNMERMNGQEAIRKIRSNPAHDGLKVFAVSGMSQADAGIEIGPEGVDRWFRKPLKPELLVQELDRELSLSSCNS